MMASFATGGAGGDEPRRRRGQQQPQQQRQRPQQRSVSFNDRSVEPLAPQPGGDNISLITTASDSDAATRAYHLRTAAGGEMYEVVLQGDAHATTSAPVAE